MSRSIAALSLSGLMRVNNRGDESEEGLRLDRISAQLPHVQRAVGGDIKDRLERVISLDGQFSTDERQHLPAIAERCPVSPALKRQFRHHIVGGGGNAGNRVTHLMLAEEQAQIDGVMADKPTGLDLQVTAGEFARMPVAPTAALIPEMVRSASSGAKDDHDPRRNLPHERESRNATGDAYAFLRYRSCPADDADRG